MMFGIPELGTQSKVGGYFENYGRKHTPRIECPDVVGRGKPFDVSVVFDAQTELSDHMQFYVRWVTLYFFPELFGSPYRLEKIYLDPKYRSYPSDSFAVTTCTIDESGTLYAIAFYNVQEFFYSRKKIWVVNGK